MHGPCYLGIFSSSDFFVGCVSLAKQVNLVAECVSVIPVTLQEILWIPISSPQIWYAIFIMKTPTEGLRFACVSPAR